MHVKIETFSLLVKRVYIYNKQALIDLAIALFLKVNFPTELNFNIQGVSEMRDILIYREYPNCKGW